MSVRPVGTCFKVSNVPLNDVIRPITFACILVTMELEPVCDLRIRPTAGVLKFARPGDGVACSRRQDTPMTVFLFAILLTRFLSI